MDINNYTKKIFKIKSESEFNDLALELFQYQYKNNKVYNKYINLINYNTHSIKKYSEIPFLPIELFRTQKIILNNKKHETIFLSSGTTNEQKSKHYLVDLEIYKKSILNSFNLFFENPKEFVFFCLISDFKNQPNSSLSFMCSKLIQISGHNLSGFYLKKETELISNIRICQKEKKKFILFGLSFGILDFAEKNNLSLKGGIVIQTGGTKTNNKHVLQEDLHEKLKSLFNIEKVYSEYGMAELLSQSYYKHDYFESPPWKKVLIRDKTNPFKIEKSNKRGCINIIDLANIYSCSFIATNDFGYLTKNGFNIIGRAQNATERGCSLMV